MTLGNTSASDEGGMSYDEIAEALGIGREQVRAIERRAIRKLRRYVELLRLELPVDRNERVWPEP